MLPAPADGKKTKTMAAAERRLDWGRLNEGRVRRDYALDNDAVLVRLLLACLLPGQPQPGPSHHAFQILGLTGEQEHVIGLE